MATITILAIGTEVTTGEIVNTNTSWLANKLEECGVTVNLHFAVSDDEESIIEMLEFASGKSRHIITIGGLGPTSDDCTRDSICKWAKLNTYFDAVAWQKIETRFQALGRTAPESNKKQCQFPDNCKIFENTTGTANGFSIFKNQVEIISLPGPPSELQQMWFDHLASHFQKVGKGSKTHDLLIWSCLGIPESTLAEKVEKIIISDEIKIGYRASSPLVHVKLWVPRHATSASISQIEQLDEALKEFCISKNGDDPLKNLKKFFASQVQSIKFCLVDGITDGFLANRLTEIIRSYDIPFNLTTTRKVENILPIPTDEDTISLEFFNSSNGATLRISNGSNVVVKCFTSEIITNEMRQPQRIRNQLILAERALHELAEYSR